MICLVKNVLARSSDRPPADKLIGRSLLAGYWLATGWLLDRPPPCAAGQVGAGSLGRLLDAPPKTIFEIDATAVAGRGRVSIARRGCCIGIGNPKKDSSHVKLPPFVSLK